jgi:hypothetical protein
MSTTADVTACLRERYCAPEFAFFEEVGDAGSMSRVHADGVAINMWASRGYAITGFEVKVSRSDWLRELKQPEKAEPIIRKCDYFYLVAPEEIYKPDEVPPSWGILGFKDGKLREKRKAPKLEPEPITRQFVAQMFRRGHQIETRNIEAIVNKAMIEERAANAKRVESAVTSRTRDLERMAEKWRAVERAIGSEWLTDEKLIEAVRIVMKSGVQGVYDGLPQLLASLRRGADQIEKALEPLRVPEIQFAANSGENAT